MKVLRHEEHDTPSAVNSNGSFSNPWSKTVVGYRPEQDGFSIHLTYNYGVQAYKKGSGLVHIAVGSEDPEGVLSAAESMGYEVVGDEIIGPDGYRFRVLPMPRGTERFMYVALRVQELPKAVSFYGDVLRMNDLTVDYEHYAFNRGGSDLMRVVGYQPDNQAVLMLFEDPTLDKVVLEQWEGRNVLVVPEAALREACEQLGESGSIGAVLHEFSDAHDGDEVQPPCAVLKDVDGYEVSLSGPAAAAPADSKVDWAWREEKLSAL